MTTCVTRPCWKLYVWKGHWQVKSTHDTQEAGRAALSAARARNKGVRFALTESTRKVATWQQPLAPTAAQRFREQQADNMVLRRQAYQYFKSSCNGTEVVQPPRQPE